jgi:hypothetical protein
MNTRIPLLVLASTSFATAATYTTTANFSDLSNGTQLLTLQQLALGAGETLMEIRVTVSNSKTGGSLAVDNETGYSGTVNLSQSLLISISSADVTLADSFGDDILQNVAAKSTASVTIGADDGDANPGAETFDIGGPDYQVVNFSGTVTKTSNAYIGGDYWSHFLGTGSFNVELDASQSTSVSITGAVSQQTTPPTSAGYVTITYTTAGGGGAVPEPSVVLLGGLGFLILLRRRRTDTCNKDSKASHL